MEHNNKKPKFQKEFIWRGQGYDCKWDFISNTKKFTFPKSILINSPFIILFFLTEFLYQLFTQAQANGYALKVKRSHFLGSGLAVNLGSEIRARRCVLWLIPKPANGWSEVLKVKAQWNTQQTARAWALFLLTTPSRTGFFSSTKAQEIEISVSSVSNHFGEESMRRRVHP